MRQYFKFPFFKGAILFFLLLVFTNTILAQDTVSPTVSLSSSDIDKLIATSDTVTITASFSEAMTATPTLSISGGLLSSTAFTSYIQGVQLGADIDGEARGDLSGNSVSLSSDGSIVAIGASSNGGTASLSGHVRIYRWNGSGWTQLGADIDGEAESDYFGDSVSLSSDGSRVAIGATHNDGPGGYNRGHVRIYDYTPSGVTSWTQVSGDIDGEASNDQSGYSVSLSSDGSRVAIGARLNDAGNSDANYDRGHVRVFKYQVISGTATWTQVGADIDGVGNNDQSGYSVSLSSDGSRVAIGAYDASANSTSEKSRGRVHIYDYSGGSWTQVSGDIDGEAAVDNSGSSVSLSSDGSIVAIGAKKNDGNGTNSGHVRIFKYQVISGTATWTQVGGDIDGEAAGDYSGISVSLSSDGSRVAIGASSNGGGAVDPPGHTRIYSLNGSTWTQVGVDIDGEAAGDYSGGSVSLSSDGSRVAIGSTGNDGSFTSAGHVRVYTIGEYQYAWDVDGNGTPSDGSYSATVSGTDTAGNAYVAGTQSITFTIDTTAPSVSLTNNDGDNVINNSSSVVTITATFNEAMTDSPTITIGNGVSNVTMTKSSTTIWTYYLNMASWGGSGASAVVTVTGSDIAGNAYSGTDSFTFTIDTTAPTISGLSSNDGDNVINGSSAVTITATFNESMSNSPTITIGDGVTNVAMTATSSTVWTYYLNMASWGGSQGHSRGNSYRSRFSR